MSVDEVIEYVMHTPGNTNPNILKIMINELINNDSQEPKQSDVVGTGQADYMTLNQ